MNKAKKTQTIPKQKRQKPRQHQRLKPPYILVSGVEHNRIAPDTFSIHVKLMFRFPDHLMGERMWVIVKDVRPEYYVGVLTNYPVLTECIRFGQKMQFHSDHVIDIDRKGDEGADAG